MLIAHMNPKISAVTEGRHVDVFVSPTIIRNELAQLIPDGGSQWLRGLSQVASLIFALNRAVIDSDHRTSCLLEDPKVALGVARVMRVAGIWRARVGTRLIQMIRISINVTQHLAYTRPDLAAEISDDTAQVLFTAVIETALFGSCW